MLIDESPPPPEIDGNVEIWHPRCRGVRLPRVTGLVLHRERMEVRVLIADEEDSVAARMATRDKRAHNDCNIIEIA